MILLAHPDGRYVPLDATLKVSISRSVAVAKHPMEQGVPSSDHAEPSNFEVVLTCKMTETPTQQQADREYPGYGVVNVVQGKTGTDRINATVAFLQDCEGELLDIASTSDRVAHVDMLLTQYPHEWGIVRTSPFTLSFTKPRIVETGTARVPPRRTVPATITDEEPDAEQGVVETVEKDRSVLDTGGHAVQEQYKKVMSWITGG